MAAEVRLDPRLDAAGVADTLRTARDRIAHDVPAVARLYLTPVAELGGSCRGPRSRETARSRSPGRYALIGDYAVICLDEHETHHKQWST